MALCSEVGRSASPCTASVAAGKTRKRWGDHGQHRWCSVDGWRWGRWLWGGSCECSVYLQWRHLRRNPEDRIEIWKTNPNLSRLDGQHYFVYTSFGMRFLQLGLLRGDSVAESLNKLRYGKLNCLWSTCVVHDWNHADLSQIHGHSYLCIRVCPTRNKKSKTSIGLVNAI